MDSGLLNGYDDDEYYEDSLNYSNGSSVEHNKKKYG